MNANALPGLVIILSVLLQIWTMIAVGRARRRTGINAPVMTGDAGLERALRVQANTIEQLVLTAPAFVLSQIYWGSLATGICGLVWILGRVLYAIGYWQDPKKRGSGFMIASLATLVLLVGGGVGWVRTLL